MQTISCAVFLVLLLAYASGIFGLRSAHLPSLIPSFTAFSNDKLEALDFYLFDWSKQLEFDPSRPAQVRDLQLTQLSFFHMHIIQACAIVFEF